MSNYRILNISDVEQFRKLRLEALKCSPQSFASTYDYERKQPLEKFTQRLIDSEDKITVGAFEGDRLIANCTYFRETGDFIRHKGQIVAVYCTPEYQNKGITTNLLSFLIDIIKEQKLITVLLLSVNSENKIAIKTYEKLGFSTFGIEERALFDGKKYRSENLMQKLL